MPHALRAEDDIIKKLKFEADIETLANALPLLADPATRNNLRTTLLELDPFPSQSLVTLLSHPQLAVRLGALETLEEKAGGDFGFNPWATDESNDNIGPLARWNKWLGDGANSSDSSLLTTDQRHAYLRDLLADDNNRAARARRMLEADGLAAVGFLEEFLTQSTTLPAGSRAKIREAQYQIVLSTAYGPQAPTLARHLAFGSRDQTLAAIGNLKSAGLNAIPIIADFINHPDALVRETAMDAILASGGTEALPVVGPALIKESDPNVIHGALRRLKEIPGDESLKIAVSFLDRNEEDLLISAIQACQKLAGGTDDRFSNFGSGFGSAPKPKVSDAVNTANQAVIKALSDPRWRVRTAALEYVTATKTSEAGEKCIELINDPDEFVRFSAIKAATALNQSSATPILRKMLMENPSSLGPILEGYAALGSAPDEEMMQKFASYSPDSRIAAINAATTNSSRLSFIPLRFATDPDVDVACAALRFLASDEERIKNPEVASVLLESLRANNPEKTTAILDRLDLPREDRGVDPELSAELSKYLQAPEKTALDPLYDSLLGAASATSKAASSGIKTIADAKNLLIEEILKIAKSNDPNNFRAALCLGIIGNNDGLKILHDNLPGYSTAQRSAIASKIYDPSSKVAYDLIRKLIHDPIEEIRTSAIESALSASNTHAFLSMVLEAIAQPDAKIAAHQVYSYRFAYAARDNQILSGVLQNWALKTISDTNAPDANRILAFISLSQNLPSSAVETTLSVAKSHSNKWMRRAAWHALASSTSQVFRDNVESLAKDESPFVREVLAEVRSRISSSWKHRFDDVNFTPNNSWDSSRGERRLHAAEAAVLTRLAEADPSPNVRFESMLALLSHNKEIDAEHFATLLRTRPPEDKASSRVAEWMHENLQRLGPGMATIISALNPSETNPRYMSAILAKAAPKKKNGSEFTSFAALAANSKTTTSSPQLIIAEEESEKPKIDRESLKVVYFFKPGCAECEKAAQLLEALKSDFPKLKVERHNINETDGTLYNQALCARFSVPSQQHSIAPSIFSQAGFLVRENITPQALGKLLSNTMNLEENDAWSVIAEPELESAKADVETRYKSLTLPVVLIAGLVDGLNPCAFATIIFFLSYLQISRRTRGEMIMVGIAFISAVFIAYFSAGLILHSILEQMMDRISGIKPYFDWLFAGLAMLAAYLSFRDAAKAKAGKLDEMALTLPGFLKDRIRSVVRTGARARRFILAAFVAGIAISFLELACTGQVYTPIIYSIQQGRADAVAWLLAYNLAFILPLVVIFVLTLTGMTNQALIDFQSRHTFSVKIALGLIFVALAVVILFGSRWL